MRYATHNNTDHSNALCNCRLGKNHGNTPAGEREQALQVMLRGLDVKFVSDNTYTLVVPHTPGSTPKVHEVLRSFGFDPQYRASTDEGGRGLRIAAGAFLR